MNITRHTDAISLAALARIERERATWLRTFTNVPEEQRGLTQCYFDEQASEALTITLADAACEWVRVATGKDMP